MEKRESEIIEFKKSTSELKQGVISIASMLNKSNKGTLYFGVLNDGTIYGQQIGKDTTHDISVAIKSNIKPTIIPNIEIVEINSKQVVKVSFCGYDTPYSAFGRYYIRSDEEDILMTNNILQSYFEKKNLIYSDWENEITNCTVDDIDEERLISYFNQANDCGRLTYNYKDPYDALNKLGLLKNGYLNHAGLYLFGNSHPLKLKLAIFNTDERLSFNDIKLFEGNIFDCIEEGIRYISKNMKWSAEIIGEKRVETPEVPIEAIREIVVNSFAHMKYSSGMLNEIYFTPSKIKITNPGQIANDIDPIEFANGNEGPILRNPLIALTLYKNNTIDSFATGFERTFKLCKQAKVNYEYKSSDLSFSFTFLRNVQNTPILKKALPSTITSIKPEEKSESRQSSILGILKKNPYSTRESISTELETSQATIARDLKILQELNIIKRIGANKNGYWEIL